MLTYMESRADTACKLECLQNQPPVHEFVGPVKILLIDVPQDIYRRRMCISALIGMAQMMIGATVITVLYFTLSMKPTMMTNLHIMLCTFGYQLCLPSGILMISNLNGPSAQMKESGRKLQHLLIQLIGLMCVTAGTVLPFIVNGDIQFIFSAHSISGLAAYLLILLSALQGPILYIAQDSPPCLKYSRGTHIFFGVPGFIASSVCFCLGLIFSKKFNNWVPMVEMVYIPVLFCFLYTIIVIIPPLMKCFSKVT